MHSLGVNVSCFLFLVCVHALLQTLGQLVVVSLQLVVELNQIQNLLEVLHEFLVVDLSVVVDIGQQVKGQGLLVGQLKICQFFERLLEVEPLQVLVVVDVALSECREDCALLVCGHLHVVCSKLTHSHKLRLATLSFHFVHGIYLLFAHLRECVIVNHGLFVWICEAHQDSNLERSKGQLFAFVQNNSKLLHADALLVLANQLTLVSHHLINYVHVNVHDARVHQLESASV